MSLEKYYPYCIIIDENSKSDWFNRENWLIENNCRYLDNYAQIGNQYWFRDRNTAILFKLTFGGNYENNL